MPAPSLSALLRPKSAARVAVESVLAAMDGGLRVEDSAGKLILQSRGEKPQSISLADSTAQELRLPIETEGATLGYVIGQQDAATAMASLLTHFAAREAEGRSLASEVLHLYREFSLIEQLSEQLAALLNLSAVCQSALAQAQRLIRATHGSILVMETADSGLRTLAAFDGSPSGGAAIAPNSQFAASIVGRGVAEIINNAAADPRAMKSEQHLRALVCAPLRTGQRTIGLIALASTGEDASYTAADLKLLNTIALQTAAAIANTLLCAEMVETARRHAALASELQAVSTVQQLLLQGASRPTPGFQIESVYVPASEVGGDFFFVSPAADGSLTAIVGDVSGKGLPAAMRVALILGLLHRETSHNPSEILGGLNDALVAQGQFGFTTACCVRLSPSGKFLVANAGHIAPYLSGRELETPPSLPLGLIPGQAYDLVEGALTPSERLVLLSDGVPEARSQAGDLLGFNRLAELTLLPAREIADTACAFGQEDDITVLTLTISSSY